MDPHPVGTEVGRLRAVGDSSALGAAGLFFREKPHRNMRRIKDRHCLSIAFLL
jgi:hypothetical protein